METKNTDLAELEKAIRNSKITWQTLKKPLVYCFAILVAFIILTMMAHESTAEYLLSGYNEASTNEAQYESLSEYYSGMADLEGEKKIIYNAGIEDLKNGVDVTREGVDLELQKLIPGETTPEGKDFVASGSRTSFLQNNASDELKDRAQTFVDVGFDYGVDPDLLVCIAFADSGLGNDLATAYNYGNVGNNDRGDRVALDNVTDGIAAMAETLNNQYLGSITTVGDLSYGGGGDGYVYATSEFNWNNNVLNCLRDIKSNNSIDEGYEFRL